MQENANLKTITADFDVVCPLGICKAGILCNPGLDDVITYLLLNLYPEMLYWVTLRCCPLISGIKVELGLLIYIFDIFESVQIS